MGKYTQLNKRVPSGFGVLTESLSIFGRNAELLWEKIAFALCLTCEVSVCHIITDAVASCTRKCELDRIITGLSGFSLKSLLFKGRVTELKSTTEQKWILGTARKVSPAVAGRWHPSAYGCKKKLCCNGKRYHARTMLYQDRSRLGSYELSGRPLKATCPWGLPGPM